MIPHSRTGGYPSRLNIYVVNEFTRILITDFEIYYTEFHVKFISKCYGLET